MNLDRNSQAQLSQRQLRHLPRGIAVIGRHPPVVRGHPDRRFRRVTRRNRNYVMHFQRLVHGHERMEAIGARRANSQAEVHLRVRPDMCGHTGSL